MPADRVKYPGNYLVAQPYRLDLLSTSQNELIEHIRNNRALGYFTVPVVDTVGTGKDAKFVLRWKALPERLP